MYRVYPILFVAALASCSANQAQDAHGASTSVRTVRATSAPAIPTAIPSPPAVVATAAPTAQATATVSPSPQPLATAAILPPDAPPRIVAVQLDTTTFHSGQTVRGAIVTSSNVASLETRVGSFSQVVPKVGVGRFELSYTVPSVPFFMHGSYQLTFIARNSAGATTTRIVPIVLQ